MDALRTCFNTIFIAPAAILWLAVSALVAEPFLYFFGDKNGKMVRKFVYVQSRGIVFFMRLASRGLRVEIAPRTSKPYVVVANHASALDLYTIGALGFDNVVYITKGWVFKIPFFHFVMDRAGYLDAEKTPPEEMLSRCQKAVENGCSIVLFPQGSRKNPQARFKSGAFYLAEKLNLPVVPVAIAGTQIMLPAGAKCIKAAKIVLKSFPEVSCAGYGGEIGHLKMAQDIKKQIMNFVNQECV